MKKPRKTPEARNGVSDLFPITEDVRVAAQNFLGDGKPLPADILSLRKRLKEKMLTITDSEETDEILRLLENTNILAKLSELYDYIPEPLTEETIPLKIDFSCLDTEIQEIAEKYDTIQSSLTPLFYRTLPAENGDVEFLMSKVIKGEPPNEDESMTFELQDNLMRDIIGIYNFRCIRTEKQELWDLRHRIISPSYRNQGIGSELMKKAELFFQKRANSTRKKQTLSMIIRQADVLVWALNNGFVPSTTEGKEHISRLMQGDPNLTIASGVGEEDWRQWYIFEKEKYLDTVGNPKPEIWDAAGKDSFLQSAFKTDLVKTFCPQ